MAGSTRLRRTGWKADPFLATAGLASMEVGGAGIGEFVDAMVERMDRWMGWWMSETRRTTGVEGLQGLIRNPSAERVRRRRGSETGNQALTGRLRWGKGTTPGLIRAHQQPARRRRSERSKCKETEEDAAGVVRHRSMRRSVGRGKREEGQLWKSSGRETKTKQDSVIGDERSASCTA